MSVEGGDATSAVPGPRGPGADAAARRSHAQFENLANSLPQLCWMADEDGWIYWYNQRWYDYTGTTLEEMQGWGWEKVHDPVELARMSVTWKRSLATGQDWEDTFPLRGRDGAYRWFLSRAVPIRDAEGRVTGWFGTNTDITAQRAQAQALRDREQRLQLAKAAAGLGIHDYDVRTSRIGWDERVRELWGVPPDETITYETFVSGLHPDDRAATQAAVDRALDPRGGGRYDAEYRVIHRGDGAVRWVAATGTASFEDGHPVRLVGTVQDITARKQADERLVAALHTLRDREHRLSGLLGALPDAYLTLDKDWRFTFINAQAAARFGEGRGDVLGRNIWEVFPEAVGGEAFRQFTRAMAERVGVEYEVYFAPWDRWFFDKVNPTADGGLAVYSADITPRKRAEQALQAQKRLYKSVTDNASTAMFIMDERQQCVFMNPAAEALTGFTFEEVRARGGALHDIIHHTHPDGSHYPLSECPIDQAFPTQHQTRGEEVFVHRDGRFYTVEFTASPLMDPGGDAVGTVIEVQDITPRKQAEAELARRERLLSSVTEHARVGLVIVSPEHRYLYANQAYARVLGLRTHEIVGRAVAEVLPGSYAAQIRPRLLKAFAGERVNYELTIDSPPGGGPPRTILAAYDPQQEGGVVTAVVVAVSDISDRKAAERELQCYREGLEHMVEERTRQLAETHRRLRDTERLSSLGTLTAGLGHDLHNALLPLRVHVQELTVAGKENPSIAENAASIEAVVNYLGALSQGMRMLSKNPDQDAGGVTDLLEWQRGAARVLAAAAGREVALTINLAPGLPSVPVADHRLTQALFNLVQNAADALRGEWAVSAGHTGGTIAIAARGVEGGWVELTVTDNGPGMDEEVRRRCLEPFFTTKIRGMQSGKGGTGMGLALVVGIIHAAGGRVEVESREGEGSTFRLLLPSAPELARPDQAARVAWLELRDQRCRSAVAALLTGAEWEVKPGGPQAAGGPSTGFALWVTEPGLATPSQVSHFVDGTAVRRAIVVAGAGDAAPFADMGERVTVLDPGGTLFSGLRRVLRGFDSP